LRPTARGTNRSPPPKLLPDRFVVQKHHATNLHYDFRLEVDGVLKSWAVPKGPSMDPKDRRLAMPVEDHALDYIDFEGVIPEGYGAGPVIVWDIGTYRNITEVDGKEIPIARALEEGYAAVWLEGTKITGGWSLRRVSIGRDTRPKWLLVKKRDETVDLRSNPTSTRPESVLTGRTIEQVREKNS